MEIADILKSENLNINSNPKTINIKRENKFQQLLDKNTGAKTKDTKEIYHRSNTVDTKLMNACIEMESIFVSKMLKEMRNTLPKEKLIDGGFAEQIFEDMLYDEHALNISKTSNLGLAKMLYNELSNK
jgi:Rod binding domain-containing protein